MMPESGSQSDWRSKPVLSGSSPNSHDRRHDQLPHLEEARFWVAQHSSSRHDGRRKRKALLAVLCGCVFFAIVMITVGVVSFMKRNSSSNDGKSAPKENDRYQSVITYLSQFSAPGALRTKGTPQYRAAVWMAHDDTLAYDVPDNIFSQHFRQRYALATFFYAMGGENWESDWNFLSESSECFWNTITKVNDRSLPMGVTCDDDQEIMTLTSGANNLSGNLPPELGLLTRLNFLWIPENSVVGTLPDQLQNLSNMDTLNVDKNRLHGTIPAWISSWKLATTISIQHNKFSGSLPTEIGKLSMLMNLQVENNKMTGTIPSEVTRFTDLQRLILGRNEFEGELSPWLPSNVEELSGLRLSENKFSGPLPTALGNIVSLERLWLDGNMFTGDVSVLKSLTNLEGLFLQGNGFEADINGLASFIGKLTDMRLLDGSDNSFFGSLPLSLFTHDKLGILDFHNNSLSGSIPTDIPENQALKYLTLQSNNIKYEIPPALSNIKSLHHLDLSDNNLEGNIVSDLGTLRKLTHLSISGNSFNKNPFPDFLKQLTKLRELTLRLANLQGTIPEWINQLEQLSLLDLAHNELTGTIPVAVGELATLQYLLLNRNLLNGTVPETIQNLPELSVALLSENDITGNVGSLCIGDKPDAPLEELQTDCGGVQPEVACPCCTVCCEDGTDGCTDHETLSNQWTSVYSERSWHFVNEIDEMF